MEKQKSNASVEIDLARIADEWPRSEDGSLYLNTGSCGVKPKCVLEALQRGAQKLNANPTDFTFLSTEAIESARFEVASLFNIPEECLLFTSNTSFGLQLVLQSFLRLPQDELITTDSEHGSLSAIARLLEEERQVTVKRCTITADLNDEQLCQLLLRQVTPKTKLVVVSEIHCYSGWRPNLFPLVQQLKEAQIPLLVDGAHAPGQGPCSPSSYPMWVGSGHKWMGGPNGTAFVYVSRELIHHLRPLTIGDRYFEKYERPIQRFEWSGTADNLRWLGLAAACQLQGKLDIEKVERRQAQLVTYLRSRLSEMKHVTVRTPSKGRTTGLLAFTVDPAYVAVPDLRAYLWEQHKIWVQPDLKFGKPEHGARISCHVANSEEDLDHFIEAFSKAIKS